ncbi:BsuBI/PstI family type II restriction endonuclease [Sphingomonas yantingensis]|uniref:BsuBI/PstI restriction endonuclease domain-containing protein n=1 Tax=Sphingomonas yantingensis TaxID=1241761 RepID=A0A7W9ASZ5_9SPHN|nr:BsuBI/PstI family type II restriction endonuclease [Sphingomonas yantingensis]MBB5699998.1 hypothetical protein [Sphingomonas yantingensis]
MAKIEDVVQELRERRIRKNGYPVPDAYQGVTRDKVREVLSRISLSGNADLVDAVFAMLDDETASWMPNLAPSGAKFADGATTAHIACHVGILQRGRTKLDREGRDYWIKPLRDLGGFEAIYLHQGQFIAGHPKPKSPSSAYRLEDAFKAILVADDGVWQNMLSEWASKDAARQRLEFQAEIAERAKGLVDNNHGELIKASVDLYAAKFLPGYEALYIDDSDGDRVSAKEKAAMARAGVKLELGDAMPDVLLWNPETDHLWVIEAVTSDGEVDITKVTKMTEFAQRHGKSGVGFTTTYLTWKDAAGRQGTHRNIAIDTYIWIQGDPSKQLFVGSYDTTCEDTSDRVVQCGPIAKGDAA